MSKRRIIIRPKRRSLRYVVVSPSKRRALRKKSLQLTIPRWSSATSTSSVTARSPLLDAGYSPTDMLSGEDEEQEVPESFVATGTISC